MCVCMSIGVCMLCVGNGEMACSKSWSVNCLRMVVAFRKCTAGWVKYSVFITLILCTLCLL